MEVMNQKTFRFGNFDFDNTPLSRKPDQIKALIEVNLYSTIRETLNNHSASF